MTEDSYYKVIGYKFNWQQLIWADSLVELSVLLCYNNFGDYKVKKIYFNKSYSI